MRKVVRSGCISFSVGIWLLFIVLSVDSFAATYYVSPFGSDSNSGLIGAPFKTIQKCANVVNPGDTCMVKDGMYQVPTGASDVIRVNRGGSAVNPVTFKSENKWGAKLDGTNLSYSGGIHVSAPYVVIDGFEIQNMRLGGIGVYVSNVTIQNNNIHNIGNYHLTDDYPWCTVYGVPEPGCGNPSHATSAIFPSGDNIVIDSNIMHSIGKTGWTGKYEPGRYDHAVYGVSNKTGLTITNNIIYDVWTGTALDLAANNALVANNTILRLTEPPVGPINATKTTNESILMTISGGGADNQIVVNNIFYGCNGQSPIHKIVPSTNGQIRNNLSSPDCPLFSGMVYQGGNVLSGNIDRYNPLFVDLPNRNFHLQASSPAIDRGMNISGYTYDADEKPIVGAPDIGAYEYGSASTPPPATSNDTTSPSVPTGLTASVSSSQISLSWTASTDNIRVTGYKIYRGSSLIATVTTTSYTNTGLTASTAYTYTVSAYDAAGNVSSKSASVSAKTQAVSAATAAQASSIDVSASVKVWLAAEKGALHGRMKTAVDTQASGRKYIAVRDGKGDVMDPLQSGGYAKYSFKVPVAGSYIVWGRVMADILGDGSFFVKMDNGPYALWDTALSGTATWVWDQVNDRVGANPVIYSLDAGKHTLIIKQRTDGTKIDRILITNASQYIPQQLGK